MTTIHPGRFTSHIDGDFVVFLIGLRVNRLLALSKWIPTAQAMGPMLRSSLRETVEELRARRRFIMESR